LKTSRLNPFVGKNATRFRGDGAIDAVIYHWLEFPGSIRLAVVVDQFRTA
jgi:hypothetical protein